MAAVRCLGFLYDVIADHPRLVFDGANILLKLHVDLVYILRDIAIFIFVPWLFFGGGI